MENQKGNPIQPISSVVPQGRDFANFKKNLTDIASESLNTYYNGRNIKKGATTRKTPEEIEEILLKGNERELRTLSRSYWDISGLYKRLILYIANMLTYDVLVTPKIIAGKNAEKDKVIKTLTSACYFIDSLNIEKELSRIMTIILTDGVYYGLFKECSNGKFIFQDLDADYCRTRYKSMNDLPVLEFDLTYFINLKGREATTNVDELALYPKAIRSAYNKYFNEATYIGKDGKTYIRNKQDLINGRWMIIPDSLGVVFYYKDTKPLFASTIKAIEDLNDYKGIEKSLDKQELQKIYAQRIPIDEKTGELLFTPDEAFEIHKAVVKMLKNNPNVDVLTTFAEAQMLDLQDSSQANRDNLEKMERSVYNEAGVSKNLFASDGTTALDYSQKVDMALALDISKMFATFLSYHANRKFLDKKVFLEVTILPITHYNREEMFNLYLQSAQYGYSKIIAGVASGVKQSNLLNLITLENDYLDLATKMVPLQSSHTTSGKEGISDKGGAPTKKGMEKSDKTRQNEESK